MKRFPGGVHPAGHKRETQDCEIVPLRAGAELVYPLQQHIGVPAVPAVAAGDTVRKGQCLAAAAEGKLSVPIHSAVSGKVREIAERDTVGGGRQRCIVVENDGQETWADGIGAERDTDGLTEEEILRAIGAAGLVGLGGAGFPTEAKLRKARETSIDRIIFNGAECEPYLTDDYRLMLERAPELIAGVLLWMRLFPGAQAVIGVEDNKPEAVRALRQAAEGTAVRVAALPTRYPQGSERSLIYALTGRKLTAPLLPPDVGCVVQNVATVLAGYAAVRYGRPLLTRTMTVAGDAVARPGNFEVPLGMSYAEVLEAAGGLSAEAEKLVSGGPMTGTALLTAEVPVTKTSSALLAFRRDPVAAAPTTACIRCGHCLTVCPAGLMPQKLVQCVERGDLEGYERLGGLACVACGACSYGCPARIPLTQAFRYARQEIGARRRKGAVKA